MRLFAAVSVCLLFCVPCVFAADNCQDFKAMSRLDWVDPTGYQGPVIAILGTEVLFDGGSKPAGVQAPATKCQGSVCQDVKGQFKFDFGSAGSFTVEADVAVYDKPPFDSPNPMMGYYRTTNKIVAGTGRFENAAGNLSEAGPFLAWWEGKSLKTIYNGTITGKVCGVKPPAK